MGDTAYLSNTNDAMINPRDSMTCSIEFRIASFESTKDFYSSALFIEAITITYLAVLLCGECPM